MADDKDQLKKLYDKVEQMLQQQENLSEEVKELRQQIVQLKSEKTSKTLERPEVKPVAPIRTPVTKQPVGTPPSRRRKPAPKKPRKPLFKLPDFSADFEKFIGENLINKIGILITIIGVAIGAKYSIEHDLISPSTRIVMGYLVGLGLLGVGIKLKKNYEGYSAVLVSGAMTIMYFITYAAYSFYGLIPQVLTFGLMTLFTIFTVIAALNYNRQVIAIIGLVGAYAVPFLLSSDTGQAAVLFGYMAIINVGILVIAFKKYWKPLYYVAFVLTWLIYITWYAFDYEQDKHFTIALLFASIFFLTFYGIFLAFKFIQKQQFRKTDIILVLANSFIFYTVGYLLLQDHETGKELLGLFTLANGIVHFIVSVIIYQQKLADRSLFYLVSGLVLIFITMAIPVQLDGNWVTLLWAGEAALLFWIGRTKGVSFYEKLSYPIMFLALFSLLDDWTHVYTYFVSDGPEERIRPILNINFLSSLLFLAAFGFINYLHVQEKYPTFLRKEKGILKLMNFAIPSILVIALYGAFKVEIDAYWDQLFQATTVYKNNDPVNGTFVANNYDLHHFKSIWGINFTLLFVSLFALFNLNKIRDFQLGILNVIINVMILIAFLGGGLYAISELRESYISPPNPEYFQPGFMHIAIRYISLAFPALLLYTLYLYSREAFMKYDLKKYFELLLHLTILWVLSSELLHWMDMGGSDESYKLGLSILWGMYSLLMVGIGIWKNRKYLRIAAIVLFGVTLLKLFLYDISHLDTISKTVVFVSLGILLLIISFLYNKYRDKMIGEGED